MFFFPEVKFALCRLRDSEVPPPDAVRISRLIDDFTIVEAMHTRDTSREPHDRRARMLSRIDPVHLDGHGIVFRADRGGESSRARELYFFVPDPAMREALAAECAHRGVVLPAVAEKEVFVDTLRIGLRIYIENGNLKLDQEEKGK